MIQDLAAFSFLSSKFYLPIIAQILILIKASGNTCKLNQKK